MELSNERKDSRGAQESDLGGGKDLLYGWLVGRAAADLGLAQALVASEANRNEQIKRLEDTLLGQIRELEQRQTSYLDGERRSADMVALQAELARFGERQHKLETEQVGFEQLEAVISTKLREFENQAEQRSQHSVVKDLSDFKLELKLLADRVARAEFSNQQAQAQSASESRRLEELVKQIIQAECESLKTNMIEAVSQQQPWSALQANQTEWTKTVEEIRGELNSIRADSELETLRNDLALLSQRLDQLESMTNATTAVAVGSRVSEIGDKLTAALATLDSREVEIRELNGQLISLAERVAELTDRAEDRAAWEAERRILAGKFEEHVAERIRSLESRLAEKLDQRESADRGQLQDDISGLAKRIAQVELANRQLQSSSDGGNVRSQQAIEALRAELGAIKVETGQSNQESTERLIQRLEETFSSKLQQLECVVARTQRDEQHRDTFMSEVRNAIQDLAQRLAQAESDAQQTHALVINEAAQMGQFRESLLSQHVALQTKLAECDSHNGQIDSLIRELNARLFKLQGQLEEKSTSLGGREAKMAQLQLEVQKLTQIVAPQLPGYSDTANRHQGPTRAAIGLGVKAQGEALQTLKPTPAAEEPKRLLQTYDAEAVESNDLKKQLQQRMSADVERVRAELRKRAGVSR